MVIWSKIDGQICPNAQFMKHLSHLIVKPKTTYSLIVDDVSIPSVSLLRSKIDLFFFILFQSFTTMIVY